MPTPELSIVIPTLNEAATLPLLLADLAAQVDVDCEILVSDGGSGDGTPVLAARELARHRLAGRVLAGPTGRGRQLNRGATRARGVWLLFLHADSRIPAPDALATCLAFLRRAGEPRLAGHCALHFAVPPDEAGNFDYYLGAVKARLGLPGTIHGDQGFWLTREFFAELGGFREDLPVLEDTVLAEVVRQRGRWQLLPATIHTSPRRFQTEGFAPRQTLNALLMNFAMIGWETPLQRLPDLYRVQDRARPLRLEPFYLLLDDLLRREPWTSRLRIWYRTGRYVRSNAWQLRLRRLARAAFTAGLPPEQVATGALDRFRWWFEPVTGHPPGHLAAALLTWLWFRSRRRNPVRGG